MLAANRSDGVLAALVTLASSQAPGEVRSRDRRSDATGDRWLLVRDPAHPGGPGRLVLNRGQRTADSSGGMRGSRYANGSQIRVPRQRPGDSRRRRT